MKDYVVWKVEDNIGHLIINDPPANKMSKIFFEQLMHLVDNVIPISKVTAVIVYGNGRHFSSGANLEELFSNINNEVKYNGSGSIKEYPISLIENNKSFLFFQELEVPVIAAVTGVCLGSALELALFCHIRICSKNSLFGFPESTFNLIPGCGGTQNILKHTKYSKALELMLSGSNFDAQEALELNIIDKIVPKKEAVNIAIKLAKSISKDYKRYKKKDYIEKYIQ